MSKLLITYLSFLAFALAQDSSAEEYAAEEIAAIKAHFSNAGLVPDLLSTFDPIGAMIFAFDGFGTVRPGEQVSKDRE